MFSHAIVLDFCHISCSIFSRSEKNSCYFCDFCEICYFFYTSLIVVFFKYFLLKLRKQFASKFLPTRSILDVSDAKGNLFVFVLAALACSKRSVGEDGIKKVTGQGLGERMKFPYTQTRLTIKLSNSLCKKKKEQQEQRASVTFKKTLVQIQFSHV